jgi:hypothetical protein
MGGRIFFPKSIHFRGGDDFFPLLFPEQRNCGESKSQPEEGFLGDSFKMN